MPRDADGKPIETRGRRSTSQKSRDIAEKLRSYAAIIESSPRLLETVMTGAFSLSLVYFLRPRITVYETSAQFPLASFRGKPVDKITIDYPDASWLHNLAILSALILAPNIGGEIGSLIAPAATAGIFAKFIDLSFAEETFPAYDLVAGPYGTNPGGGVTGPVDVTVNFYVKTIIPRYVRALFVAAFFYLILRYVRNIGRN